MSECSDISVRYIMNILCPQRVRESIVNNEQRKSMVTKIDLPRNAIGVGVSMPR